MQRRPPGIDAFQQPQVAQLPPPPFGGSWSSVIEPEYILPPLLRGIVQLPPARCRLVISSLSQVFSSVQVPVAFMRSAPAGPSLSPGASQ